MPWFMKEKTGDLARLTPHWRGQVPGPTDPEALPMYDAFGRYPDGTTAPMTASTGQVWHQFQSGAITGGLWDSTSNSASYLEANVGAGQVISRMGGSWIFDSQGGTLSGVNPTFAIVSWADGGMAANGQGRRTRCHLTITPTYAGYWVRDVVDPAGSLFQIATHDFNPPLPLDQFHQVEVTFNGPTATMFLPDGQTWTVTDTRIAREHNPEETFFCVEPYYGGAGRPRVRIAKAWANFEPATQTPPPGTGTPTDGMAYEALPSGYGTKKIFAHYFGPYPDSVDNAAMPDYWHKNWNLASPGEGGKWTYCGGWTRDRPVIRAPRTGDWQLEDAKEDVRQALSGALDGFWCNIMGPTGLNQTRYNNAVVAASALRSDGSFKVLPMIDTNGSIGSSAASTVSDIIAFYAITNPVRGRTTGNTRRPSGWYLADGKFVVGSYKADGKTAAWWQAIFTDLLNNYGINVHFVAVLSNYNNASSLNTVASTRGVWGDGADPNIARNFGPYASQARTAGKMWMAPVWPQDIRPENGLFDEAMATESLRAYLERMIADNADMAQICTWSDFREGATINKSVKRGMAMMDITAYFVHKWKTGNYPAVLRDGFYLTHRNQFFGASAPTRTQYAATSTGAYVVGSIAANPSTGKAADGFMGHWVRPNRSPAPVNIVEVLSFFTASTDVSINVGGTVTTYTAPAGMHAHTVPLEYGTISVTATRGGSPVASLTSPTVVRATPYNQDPGYQTYSTFPGRTPAVQGQYDYQGNMLKNYANTNAWISGS